MQRESAARLRRCAWLILLAAAAAAVWWGLGRLELRADWLRLEAPPHAVAGQPLPIRLHVAPLAEPAYLCADLHWGTTRDEPKGYLATGGSTAVGQEGGTFDFGIMVLPTNALRFVTGIIYLSRTGSWRSRTLVAVSDVIPVSSSNGDNAATRLEPLRVHPFDEDLKDHPRPAAFPRLLIGLLLLAAAVTAWSASRSPAGSSGEPGPDHRWWRVLAVASALACLWELLGLESRLGAQARAMARAGDLYYPRVALQKAMISVALAATAVFLIFVRRTRASRRLPLAFFGVYLAISTVNLLSLHAIDTVAERSWLGLTVVQALKLGCAAMILRGALQAKAKRLKAGAKKV